MYGNFFVHFKLNLAYIIVTMVADRANFASGGSGDRMPYRKISLRWRAAQKYHGQVKDKGLSNFLFHAWEFLQSLAIGETALNPSMGAPTTYGVAFPDGVRLHFSIGRPAPSDPDHHADLFVEDFWLPGDSKLN